MEYTSKEKFEEAEKIEKLRTKILKYIVYKKRTESEIRQKFSEEDKNLLEDIIEYLKEQNYINDKVYVEKSIKEYISLKNISLKEITYKICQKGVKKDLVDEYICQNKEDMLKYEINSAKSLIIKKRKNLDDYEIKNFLLKKGFMSESIGIAFDEIE